MLVPIHRNTTDCFDSNFSDCLKLLAILRVRLERNHVSISQFPLYLQTVNYSAVDMFMSVLLCMYVHIESYNQRTDLYFFSTFSFDED